MHGNKYMPHASVPAPKITDMMTTEQTDAVLLKSGGLNDPRGPEL